MKFHLLATTALVCATSSIMSMQSELPAMNDCKKLTFLLDSKHNIKKYTIKTKIKAPKNKLTGQNMLELSPFKGSQVEDHIKQAYLQSATIRAIVKLENKKFLSKISPVVATQRELPYYLVKLKPLNNL